MSSLRLQFTGRAINVARQPPGSLVGIGHADRAADNEPGIAGLSFGGPFHVRHENSSKGAIVTKWVTGRMAQILLDPHDIFPCRLRNMRYFFAKCRTESILLRCE
jgi:hypothetical protein